MGRRVGGHIAGVVPSRALGSLGVALEAVWYVGGGDCSSATLSRDWGVPSPSPWVDRVGSHSPRPRGAAGPTCMWHITTSSGQASCPTSRHVPRQRRI